MKALSQLPDLNRPLHSQTSCLLLPGVSVPCRVHPCTLFHITRTLLLRALWRSLRYSVHSPLFYFKIKKAPKFLWKP